MNDVVYFSTSAMSLLYECINTVIAGQYWGQARVITGSNIFLCLCKIESLSGAILMRKPKCLAACRFVSAVIPNLWVAEPLKVGRGCCLKKSSKRLITFYY
jgi:hypothetical protein